MRRTIGWTMIIWAGLALASGDYPNCKIHWSLDNYAYNECHVNFPLLDPGNDSRTNLYLLLSDRGLLRFDRVNPEAIAWDNSPDYPFSLSDLRAAAHDLPESRVARFSEERTYEEYCQTEQSGKRDFETALQQDEALTESDRTQLSLARLTLATQPCASPGSAIAATAEAEGETQDSPLAQLSPAARAYGEYLAASDAFYRGEFAEAQAIYAALSELPDSSPWLAETAMYMQIRTAVNLAWQSGKGESGWTEISRIDPQTIDALNRAIDQYLHRYPDGRYLRSANGFKRRSAWLSGDMAALVTITEAQLREADSAENGGDASRLPDEIDRLIYTGAGYGYTPTLVESMHDPILLAAYDLMWMRPGGSSEQPGMSDENITLAQLQAQKAKFANQPGLYDYLLACHYFYLQNQPETALDFLPESPPDGRLSYTAFSAYALKARILTQLGENQQANVLWREMNTLPQRPYQSIVTQLAVAIDADQRANFDADLFMETPTITEPQIVLQVMRHSLSPKSLKKMIARLPEGSNQQLNARFILLYNDLLYGQYPAFLQDAQLYLPQDPAQYQGDRYNAPESMREKPPFAIFTWSGKTISETIQCGDLTATVTKLAKNPEDRLSLICLSEFWYDSNQHYWLNDMMEDWQDSPYTWYQVPARNRLDMPRLGDVKSRFPGELQNRPALYESVFASKKRDELGAYALHRAISCYAGSGRNQCGGKGVSEATRKRWFNRLKRDYSGYDWSQNQKYYW